MQMASPSYCIAARDRNRYYLLLNVVRLVGPSRRFQFNDHRQTELISHLRIDTPKSINISSKVRYVNQKQTKK